MFDYSASNHFRLYVVIPELNRTELFKCSVQFNELQLKFSSSNLNISSVRVHDELEFQVQFGSCSVQSS